MRKALGTINASYIKAKQAPPCFSGDELPALKRLPTGSISLDWLWGGGVVCGLPNVVWGPEGAYKTSLALRIVAFNQSRDPEFTALLLDGSGSFSGMLVYAQNDLLVDMERLFVVEVNTLEEGVEIFRQVATEGLVDMIIIDDLAVYATIKEQFKGGFKLGTKQEHSITDQSMATQAGANNTFIRRTRHLMKIHEIACLFTQQVRQNFDLYGEEFIMGGGHGLKHALRLNTIQTPAAKDKAPIQGSISHTSANAVKIGSAVTFRVVKMAVDGAQNKGTRVVTQWTDRIGIEPGRDAFMFLSETMDLITRVSSSVLFKDELCLKLGLELGLGFSTRAKAEAWMTENYQMIYDTFVPNLNLQPQTTEIKKKTKKTRETKKKIDQAATTAIELTSDPNYTHFEENEENEEGDTENADD